MDIKELQTYWDQMLIGLYGKNVKASFLPAKLIQHFRPDLTRNLLITDDGWDWFNSLELRRCRDVNRDGGLRFCMISARVDDFIGAHSMPLLLALIDRKTDNDYILENIRFFKWFRLNHKKGASVRNKRMAKGAREQREVNGSGMRFKLRTRENDKRNDWNTVK
jgi:hypothetical protein